MNIAVRHGEIQERGAGALVVDLFEGSRPGGTTGAMDGAVGGLISSAVKTGDFTGGKNQTLLLYTAGRIAAERVLVVGLGMAGLLGVSRGSGEPVGVIDLATLTGACVGVRLLTQLARDWGAGSG